MTLSQLLNQRLSAALAAAGCRTPRPFCKPPRAPSLAIIRPTASWPPPKPKTNPRALAEQVIAQLDLAGIASKIEIAGPGFINIHLDPAFLAGRSTPRWPAPAWASSRKARARR